jgi:hypothetical protein
LLALALGAGSVGMLDSGHGVLAAAAGFPDVCAVFVALRHLARPFVIHNSVAA